MSARQPTRQAPRANPAEDGSAATPAEDKRGSLRWVRDVLTRSLWLEQGRKPPPVASAASGRAAGTEAPSSRLLEQRAELGARLLVHDPETQPVRHLFLVHDELLSEGWAGVEGLPPKVIGRALMEAEILASDEPSPVLATIIERLRELRVTAEARAVHQAHEALEREWQTPRVPEVSDTNFDEYELMERSWAGTVPAGL